MSLERNKESNQSTEPKPLQEQTPTPKTIYPFSREFLKLQAQKKHQQKKAASTSQETAEQTETPLPKLDEIETRVRELAEEIGVTSEDAKRDERVMLLVAATMQMCQLLKNFSTATNAEMQKLAERELQNLNIQKQYAESVKASTVEITRDIYYQFEAEQKKAFKEVGKYLSDTSDEMEKTIYVCTAEIKKATKSAVRSAERLCRIKTIGDLFYHSAPLLVLIDIILRVIALAAQIS